MGSRSTWQAVGTGLGAIIGGVLTWYAGGSGAGAGAAAGSSLSSILLGAGVGATLGGTAATLAVPQEMPTYNSYTTQPDPTHPGGGQQPTRASARGPNPHDLGTLSLFPDVDAAPDRSNRNTNVPSLYDGFEPGAAVAPTSPVNTEEQREHLRAQRNRRPEASSLLGTGAPGEPLI